MWVLVKFSSTDKIFEDVKKKFIVDICLLCLREKENKWKKLLCQKYVESWAHIWTIIITNLNGKNLLITKNITPNLKSIINEPKPQK